MRHTLFALTAMARAVIELARARWVVRQATGQEIAALVALTGQAEGARRASLPFEVERIAFLLPRVAARLPWRADCLVQALAARRWLAALGYDSQLHLGSRKEGDRLLAHAWLTCGGHVVTGGDVDAYAPFEGQQP